MYAYLITYEAFRSGATKKHSIIFSSEKQISNGEEHNAMAEQVYRAAVTNGQANNIDDISVIGASLLNPIIPVNSKAATEKRDNDDDAFEYDDEYVQNLEAAFMELYQKMDDDIIVSDNVSIMHGICTGDA